MRRYFGWALASLVALGVTGLSVASAADLPMYKKAPPPVVEAAYNWTGFYIGGELGGIWTKANGSFVFPPPATFSNSRSTGIGGGFVGYQYQWNRVVFGVEANVVALFDQNLGRSACTPLASCAAGSVNEDRIGDAIWSVGPRLGWAAGKWMPYATGGYAATRVTNTTFSANGAVFEQFSQDRSGWYAGVGVDWAVMPNVIVGAEYRHYDFGTARSVPTLATGGLNPFDTTDLSLRADSVVVRGSYKFNWAQPIVAKY